VKRTFRRWAAIAVVAAAAVLSACGGPTAQGVASLQHGSGGGDRAGRPRTAGGDSAATTQPGGTAPGGTATRLLNEWTSCMRAHGDPSQAAPTVDAHGVITVTVPAPGGAPPTAAGQVHTDLGACSRYLSAAQNALRAADPVAPPPSQSELYTYVTCMRANGVPNYPYPTPSTPNTSNFNGTGVTPTSPSVIRISEACGRKLDLPVWWAAGWGPPGDVVVTNVAPTGRTPGQAGNGGLVPAPASGSGPNG
jgi:hypothetical protein